MPDDAALRGLARLRAPLPQSESPGLESVDPRLAQLDNLVDKNQLSDLVTEVERLFEAGIYDIRPISLYLWAAFVESGLSAVPDLFDTLAALCTDNLEALGPTRKRTDYVVKRISWLMHKMTDAIEYHEARRTREWSNWTAVAGVDVMEAALERAAAFESVLDERFVGVRTPFQKLTARLRVLSMAFRVPALPPVSIAAPVVASIRPPTHNPASNQLQMDARLGRAELGVSHEFFALIQKLNAFSTLVNKGDLPRAAVVADDLMRTIETFDPRNYFPEMFSDFSELLSKHIGALDGHWQDRESPGWKARVQFYRVDLRRFVDGSGG
jgi:hypothetical protein